MSWGAAHAFVGLGNLFTGVFSAGRSAVLTPDCWYWSISSATVMSD